MGVLTSTSIYGDLFVGGDVTIDGVNLEVRGNISCFDGISSSSVYTDEVSCSVIYTDSIEVSDASSFGSITATNNGWSVLTLVATQASSSTSVGGGGLMIHPNNASLRTELSTQADGTFRIWKGDGTGTGDNVLLVNNNRGVTINSVGGLVVNNRYAFTTALAHSSDWANPSIMNGKTYIGGWHGAGGDCYFSFGSSSGSCNVVVDGNIYVKEGVQQVATMVNVNGYDGMATLNGATTDWIRTTTNGILPVQSGGASSLGTSSWPFSNIYANNIYDDGVLLEDKYATQIASSGNITTRLAQSGFYEYSPATTALGYPMTPTNGWMHLINCQHSNKSNNFALQITAPFHEQRFFMRSTEGNGGIGWSELLHTGNTMKGTISDPNTLGGFLRVARLHDGTSNMPASYMTVLNVGSPSQTNMDFQIASSYANQNLYYLRSRHDVSGNWMGWQKLTLLDSNNYLTMATRVYNAVWNDYAEYFEKEDLEEVLEAGDIVELSGDGTYSKSKVRYSKNLVGVYSDSYGHILGGKGDGKDDENFIPVGLAGRVDVKVIGKIKKGDFITSSDIEGVGMRVPRWKCLFKRGCVIGKALEDKENDELGKIKMFIMSV